MSEELAVLKLVSERLRSAGIPYMITGSIASNFYAVPRMTRDVDLVIEMKRSDVDRLMGLFKDDFYIDRDSVMQAVDQQGMFNILHNESVIKIDFIVRKDTPYRELEFGRRREISVEGVRMWIVSPEDLVLSKLVWASDSMSEMQLGDVKNILAMARGIDYGYLEKWVSSLSLQETYRKVQS